MNKNDKIKIASVVVVILLVGLFMTPSIIEENTNNNVSNEELENLEDYEGLTSDGDKIRVNTDKLFNEQSEVLNNIDSYDINITDRLYKVDFEYSDKSASAEKIYYTKLKPNNNSDTDYDSNNPRGSVPEEGGVTVPGNQEIEIYEGRKDESLYYNGNYTYKKISSPIESSQFNYSTEKLSYKDYYPTNNLKKLISSSKYGNHSFIDNSIILIMDSKDDKKIDEVLNTSGFNKYSLRLNVSKKGIINSISVRYYGVYNNSYKQHKNEYEIEESNRSNILRPHWVKKAIQIRKYE